MALLLVTHSIQMMTGIIGTRLHGTRRDIIYTKISKVKKLAISEPELGSYLTQLSKNLDDATNSICEAYGILDLLENKMSIGGNYKDDMTSEADSVRAVLKILTVSMEKVSDTADLMSYATFKED